jgi:uncharacterized membrane protein (UPF0127 family)
MKQNIGAVLAGKKIIMLASLIMLVAASCNKSYLRQDAILEIEAHKYSVQLADTPQARADGLSGIPSISDSEGMMFLFSEPQRLQFWMKGMNFPIDIVWINGDKIVDITDNIKPEPNKSDSELTIYSPGVDADKALEVNAGWALRHDVHPGETFTLTKTNQ